MNEATETSTETTESNVEPVAEPGHSAEEKFFGVRTKITKPSEEKKSEAKQADLEPGVDSSESVESSGEPSGELEDYQKTRNQQRIDTLKYERHEAERMRDEAVKVAQAQQNHIRTLEDKNRASESLIHRGEGALVNTIKAKAQLAADQAKAEYRKAYEEGNTDNIVTSQEKMIDAQAELKEAEKYERSLPQPLTPEQQQQQVYQQQQQAYQQQQQAYQQQQQQQQVPEPDPKAAAWGKENTWFGDTSKKGMTAYAYALHEEALQDNGLAPNSDQYFQYIDKGMRDRFNDYDWLGTGGVGQPATSTTRNASSVVAPSARNNGAKSRKVKLSSTQRALAKRLGLTNQQYANQVIKEMSNG